MAATASAVTPVLGAVQEDSQPISATRNFRARNVYLNQVGYQPDQPKIATVILQALPGPDPDAPTRTTLVAPQAAPPWVFQVFSIEPAALVLSGNLSAPFFDPLAGDHVCLADLSALRQPGRYRVVALGHSGDIFTIAANAYAEPLRLAIRAFYGQRCGCKVDLGGGYKHGKCHHKAEYNPSSGRTGKLKNSGGWHDAGDYGRYIVNSGITCGTLLLAWEMYPDALRELHLDLPESGRTLPDYLAEVKWNLDWMLTLQDASDGGVWHKQTSAAFCAFIMPQKDHKPSEVIGTGADPYKNTCATADLAAVMAMAARCYKSFDPRFAERCLSAARQAFAWSQAPS